MNLAQLLVFRLRLDRGAHFRFFHSPTVYAYLMDRLGTPPKFPRRCFLLAPESGRSRYDPGDEYRFGIVLLRGAEIEARGWVHRLRRGPRSPYGRKQGAPLGQGTRLVDVVDGVTGQVLRDPSEAQWLTLRQVEEAAFGLTGQRRVTLRFHSPLLILRTPVHTSKYFMDDQVVDGEVLLRRVWAKVDEHFSGLAPAGDPPPVVGVVNGLARADAKYPKKTLMGSVGSVTLELGEPLSAPWARALVLAGLLGIGKSTAMGQGRYGVDGATPAVAWPPRPAATHCQRAARPLTIALAREALMDAGEAPGVDGIGRDDYLEALTYRLPAVQEALARGQVRASPLRGTLLRKASGGLRPLAIPTMEDRFVQRCCSEELAPSLDQLLEDSSFAYRRGLSRQRARASVRRAQEEGFEYVLDADLRSFFDIVDWGLLERRLRAYLADDPVVDLVMRWVEAPVRFGERTLPRTQGLPQGSVLSPLLANVFLDPFDEAIEARGYRLVRYADDFVVLCKREADVVRAREEVAQELERLRLELAADKTEITSFERGFDFLGYVFCRSVVLPKAHSPKPRADRPLVDEEVTADELRALGEGKLSGWARDLAAQLEEQEPTRPAHWRGAITRRTAVRRAAYVVAPGTRVTGSRRGLRVYREDRLQTEVAWETLSEIAIVGGRRMGPSLIQHAMKRRIPVSFYTRAGQPIGAAVPDRVRTPSPMTRAHWAWAEASEQCLVLARALVEAKIHNQRLVVRYQPGDNDRTRRLLKDLAGAALRAKSVEQLRGVEGQAAHVYFSRWAEWTPPSLGFARRTGRHASDPINAVLNLLYTQLFRQCWMTTVVHGLDPHLGVLHESSDRYAALAADLQEPFRFLCERLVLDVLRRRRLTEEHFVRGQRATPPVTMRRDGLTMILGDWEKRLDAVVKVGGSKRSYREHVDEQTARLAGVIRGERKTLRPFRLQW